MLPHSCHDILQGPLSSRPPLSRDPHLKRAVERYLAPHYTLSDTYTPSEREKYRKIGERKRGQLDRASDWHLAKSKCFQKESDSAPFQKYVFQVRFRSLAMFKYYRSKGSNNSFGQPRIYRTRLYYHIEFNIVKCSTRSV